MLPSLCGADVAAARVQLGGCYLRYEAVGFKQVPATQLLYKVCGSRRLSDGAGLEARREAAFEMAENGVQSSGALFYTGSYESLYVLAQCEGDLGNADCGDCIRSAADQAKAQCGRAISAQTYLHACYVSYSFYPNGVPTAASSSPRAGEGGHEHTERTVALAVGGVAALGFLIACMLFVKSALKKRGGKR
uniref:Cysteine-rich repeat secretory protein 56 n=2 Tax=Cajanus cajan TaxID=3821 RepID=A0A151T5V9_CAJCA|nr:Cysteine-rich repeat secretory protein 56 [Cajanus cajan]